MALEHCADCVKGCLHEGAPVGEFKDIAGISTYVSLPPTGTYDPTAAVLYLGDIFGQYNNALLLCDSFAAAGFATYSPDYLFGEAVPTDALNSPDFDRAGWFAKHDLAQTRPIIDTVMAALRAQGVTRFFATGYCFGGRYVKELCLDNAIAAGAVAHPARIDCPVDLDALLERSRVPLLINACEFDSTWPKECQDEADTKLGGGKYGAAFKQNRFDACSHGYATRCDLSVPEQKYGKEKAFEETVAWFKQFSA